MKLKKAKNGEWQAWNAENGKTEEGELTVAVGRLVNVIQGGRERFV
ncbi:MAG: hypothetical protein V4726_09635 [Verrucomicrobiota bacterium]